MTHLITGYRGYEHIKSADQGRFNASVLGTAQYVLEIGNQCKAQYIDNNTVRIHDGDILMHGRHIIIDPNTYEDLTIATGSSGYNRADLIVMTYVENETDGIEDAYLEVIQGTPTTGTATLPTYTAGNILEGATKNQMPLYRIDISGVTLKQSFTKLFKVMPTYATLAEKYEQEFIEACTSHLESLNILDSMLEVKDNEEEYQMAGALAVKELAEDIQTQLDEKQASITGGASSIALKNLTANRALVSDSNGKVAVSAVTATELGYLDGVTGKIQKQIDAKQESITGGASSIVSSNLTASRVLVSNSSGKVAVSPVTSTELGYLDGVTGKIQKQLDNLQFPVGSYMLHWSQTSPPFSYGTWECKGYTRMYIGSSTASYIDPYVWVRTA